MMNALLLAVSILSAVEGSAAAASTDVPKVAWRGLLDLRAARTSPAIATLRGGPGKLRFGGRDRDVNGTGDGNAVAFSLPRLVVLVERNLGGTLRFNAAAEADADREAGAPVGLLEAAVSAAAEHGPYTGRIRAGTFLPPVAGIAPSDWKGALTITPSAAATWTAEELRTLGGEAAVARKLGPAEAEVAVSLFGGADQAGRALGFRGWTLHDRITRVGGPVTLPGGVAYAPFSELDGRPGAYARASGRWDGHVRAGAAYWDNGGRAGEGGPAPAPAVWSTRFWDFTAAATYGGLTLEGQAMRGTTAATTFRRTGFGASSLTASWKQGAWTAAVRGDRFHSGGSAERGNAWTTAAHWDQSDRRRFSLEYVRVSSVGSPAALRRATVDQLLQGNARLRF